MGITPYSARGLTQTLAPIEAAIQMRRTVNGALVDLSSSQFRKFTSKITGSDQLPPSLNGVWPGAILTVSCISELVYATSGDLPDRAAVPGSSRVEGEFTYYRPRLVMLVMGFETTTDEYGAQVSWSLDLEEL